MDTRTRGEATLTATPPVDWPSPRRAWYALIVLTVALMIATLDRGILGLLVGPIKAQLGINDTQMTVISGWAFVSVYALLGLPIARLADRSSRRLIIAIGMFFWSVATACCGLAGTYWQLFLARAGVGAGESSFAPATYSILTDSFPPEKLPRAVAVIGIGFAYGISLAQLLGAGLLLVAGSLAASVSGWAGHVEPWQMVLYLVAIPGVLMAFVMATVAEPPRRGLAFSENRINGPRAPVAIPVREVIAFCSASRRTYAPMFMAMGIKAMLSFGAGFWVPELFRRTFEWSIPRTAFAQGMVGLIVAPIGLLLGSALAERFARQGRDDANIRVLLIASVLTIPTSVAFPLMPTPELALAVFGINFLFVSLGIAPANAALQIITPNQMHGQVRAAYQFVFNVVGFGLGPFLVALLTNYVFRDDAALRFSLATCAAIIGPLAVLLTWYGMKPYAASVVRSRSWA
jgi:MFS family permease